MRLAPLGFALLASVMFAYVRAASAACPQEFEELIPPTKMSPLEQLKQHLFGNSESRGRIETTDGRVILKIESMDSSEDLTFMKLAITAIKIGQIDEVAADVQGPKVLPLLNRMRSRLPKGKLVVFRGRVSMADLFERMGTDLAVQETGLVANPHRSRQWTFQDQIDFFEAIKDLGIKEACLEIHGTKKIPDCGLMNFVIRSDGNGQPIWSRAD
jgi:hypothetical protein